MWRNFGWTAVLATWTIFLVLNSGLAGERTSSEPRSDRASHEAHGRATFPVFNGSAVADPTLRYTEDISETSDRTSVRTRPASVELKNTKTRDFNVSGKGAAMSNATTATARHAESENVRNTWLTVWLRVARANVRLSKIAILKMPKDMRYRNKLASGLRASSLMLRELKGAARKRKHKERTVYEFSNGREKVAVIRDDTRAFDEEGEARRKRRDNGGGVLGGRNRAATAFFHGEFPKRPQDRRRGSTRESENSVIPPNFETPADTESGHTREIRECNKRQGEPRRSLRLTRNNVSKSIYTESNDVSPTSTTTSPPPPTNLHSRRTPSCENAELVTDATGDAIAENSPHGRAVTAAWTVLIRSSEISDANGARRDEENRLNGRRNFAADGYSDSAGERTVPTVEIYKRREEERHSEIGFKANTVLVREDSRKWNGDIGNQFTFRAPYLSDDYLVRNRISLAERSAARAGRTRRSALRTTRDTASWRREYHSARDVGTKTNEETARHGRGSKRARKKAEIKGVAVGALAAVQGDPSFANFSVAPEVAESDLAMSPRISVTRQRNPVHVRHVKSGTGCEQRRRTREVGAPSRAGLWNAAGPSRTAQFGSPFEDKPQSGWRYLRKHGGYDIGSRRPPRPLGETIDGRAKLRRQPRGISADGESISFAATPISGNANEMGEINERALSSSGSASEQRGSSGAEVAMNRGGIRDVAAREGESRSGDSGSSKKKKKKKYRRYKRSHEVLAARGSSGTSGKIARREVLEVAAITGATSRSPITEHPFVSTARTADTPPASKESFTPAPPVSRPKSRRQEPPGSLPPIDTDYERYTSTRSKIGSDSLETPFVGAPETSNVSAVETPAPLIRMPADRSAAKSETDNYVSPKEAPLGAGTEPATAGESALDVAESTDDTRDGHGARANESFAIADPQRNDDPSLRDAVENVTTEHAADDSSNDTTALLHQWPVKHSAVVEGDLVLGGLMMVHEREDTITCGPVMPQGGVQALEAMLYTLDYINKHNIVPGVKIGAHILDDCDKDTYGLEMAVDFIKGSISNIDGAEYHCNKTAVRKVISGVVGAASSVTSIQVANLLRLFRIPQVSFFSTSPELSNKQRFEYFTRTIPSDHYQVKAMVDIVLRMSWSYVSIIYEESNYGIKAFEELEELLGKYNICIAVKEKLVKDSGVAEETAYDNIVSKLLTKPRAKGCIIFGSDQEVAGVMRAVRRCNATGTFSWIGSDGWSARGLVSNGNEPEVEGTLSVQPQANPVQDFEEYFLNLTVENNRRNPWFVEFWEDHFKCRYPNASWTPYNRNYTRICTTRERLTKQDTDFEDQLQFVSDAVMAFGYAFRDMHHDLCQGAPGLCDAMKPINGTKLLQYLRKVEFKGLSGDQFRFDKNGDGPARYNIIHFKQIEPGNYKWVRVGKYLEGELRLNMSEIQFKLGHPQPPESVCSSPCKVGQIKKYVEGERCCWHCFNCAQYEIRDPEDETQCKLCPNGTLPDENHSICRNIPEEFLRPESGWAIGAMSFSASGILVTSFVCGVFLKHNDTPVVRASGRELSYVLLAGILLCYLVTFTLVLRPTDIVCGIQRFAAGLCFAIVYAALLTKTNRIARIFNDGRQSAKRPSFISPRSQLTICFGLVFVQILINGVWMMIDPARAMPHYPTKKDNLLVCNSYVDASYMIAFAYPILLIAVCTVYAVLTRKIPEAFNESKHIGFAMYTTCVIWLAFVPLYFGTETNVTLRITSMSVTISLSAYVMVFLLFGPKLYIILIRPERNVRPNIKAGRPNLTKSSAITATNPSMVGPVTATAVLTAATCDQNKAIKKHIASTIDCSTQSEYYEMEVKEQKNGQPLATCASRSTQTINEKDSTTTTTTTTVATSNKESPDTITPAAGKESKSSAAALKRLNSSARIGNGPSSQSDVAL